MVDNEICDMSKSEAVEKIFTGANQRMEAGFGSWSMIDSPLQITINFDKEDKHWVFNPSDNSGFTASGLPSNRTSLVELSAKVFLEVVDGKRNLQQAYLDGSVKVYGSVPQVLQYARLFDQLQESSAEL